MKTRIILLFLSLIVLGTAMNKMKKKQDKMVASPIYVTATQDQSGKQVATQDQSGKQVTTQDQSGKQVQTQTQDQQQQQTGGKQVTYPTQDQSSGDYTGYEDSGIYDSNQSQDQQQQQQQQQQQSQNIGTDMSTLIITECAANHDRCYWGYSIVPKSFWMDESQNPGRDFIVIGSNGWYLTCDSNGAAAASQTIGTDQLWIPEKIGGKIAAFRSYNGGYLAIHDDGTVDCIERTVYEENEFNVIWSQGNCATDKPNYILLRAINGLYLAVGDTGAYSVDTISTTDEVFQGYFWDPTTSSCLTDVSKGGDQNQSQDQSQYQDQNQSQDQTSGDYSGYEDSGIYDSNDQSQQQTGGKQVSVQDQSQQQQQTGGKQVVTSTPVYQDQSQQQQQIQGKQVVTTGVQSK